MELFTAWFLSKSYAIKYLKEELSKGLTFQIKTLA